MITHSKAFCTIFRFEKFPLAKFFRLCYDSHLCEKYDFKEVAPCLEANTCWACPKTGSLALPKWATGDPQEARRFFGISPGDTLLILGNEVSGLVVTKPQVLSDLADEILGTTEEDHGNCDHV